MKPGEWWPKDNQIRSWRPWDEEWLLMFGDGAEPCEACGLPVDDRFAHRAPSGVGWVHDRCCTQEDCRQLLELVRKAIR